MRFSGDDRMGMVGGTIFGILPNIPPDDLVLTIIMAFTGAMVSFITSMLFKFLVSLFKKRL